VEPAWTLERPGERPEPTGEPLSRFCPRLPDHEAYVHQVETVEAFREGCNVLLVAGTGAGKTEAALAAAWEERPILFVYPTKPLTRDQEGRFRKYGIKVVIADGDHDEWWVEIGEAEVVLTNPHMLWVHARRCLSLWRFVTSSVGAIVWDEVHFYDPRRANKLLGLAKALRHVPQIFMSATVGKPERLAREIERATGRRTVLVRGKGISAPRVYKAFDRTVEEDLLAMLADFASDPRVRTIVYARGRSQAERLARSLREEGLPAAYHHGALPAEEREEVEEGFRRGDLRLIVTVKTLEVGIDVGDVGRIVHLGLPPRVSDFRQREGRAGRRGEPAESILVALDSWSSFVLESPERFERLYLEGELEAVQAREGSRYCRTPGEAEEEGFYGDHDRSPLGREFKVVDEETEEILRTGVSRWDVVRYYAPGALFEHDGGVYMVTRVDPEGVVFVRDALETRYRWEVESGWWSVVITGVRVMDARPPSAGVGWVEEFWSETRLVPPPGRRGSIEVASRDTVPVPLHVEVESYYVTFEDPGLKDRRYRDAVEFALHALTRGLALAEGYPVDSIRHHVSGDTVILYEAPAAVMPELDWGAAFEEARRMVERGVDVEGIKLPGCPWPGRRRPEVRPEDVLDRLDALERIINGLLYLATGTP